MFTIQLAGERTVNDKEGCFLLGNGFDILKDEHFPGISSFNSYYLGVVEAVSMFNTDQIADISGGLLIAGIYSSLFSVWIERLIFHTTKNLTEPIRSVK